MTKRRAAASPAGLTAAQFRRIALGLKGAVEGAHMGHPDFRVQGRIFATLKGDRPAGMVKLPPDEQSRLVREWPDAFAPEAGAWGRQGCTRVTLAAASAEAVGEAMTLAWRAAAAGPPSRERPRASRVPRRRTS